MVVPDGIVSVMFCILFLFVVYDEPFPKFRDVFLSTVYESILEPIVSF